MLANDSYSKTMEFTEITVITVYMYAQVLQKVENLRMHMCWL
jgi:hypothetical protein